MGYRITIESRGCFNCGVCMDVCPVQALDMSRPERAGVEAGGGSSLPLRWMMEYPTQVAECIGCGICVRECPVEVVHLDTVAGSTPLAPRQGPLTRPVPAAGPAGWIPLSEATRESLKPDHPSPSAPFFAWRTSERPHSWQAWRSMVDGDLDPKAPCQAACPAGTDAGRYVGLIAQGRYDDAYAVAAEVNPFPSVCGWICTAPCEATCRRGTLDEPISIRGLKRFAAEHGKLPAVEPPKKRRSERVAIVGGGPAGMSAAYYLVRLGYGVTVFEAMPVPGGMMAIGIPAYRLPREVLREEIDRIVGLGVELRLDAAMGRDFGLSDLESQGYKAVFLATGASKSRRLGVPGDQLPGVVPATYFLKQVNLGEEAHLSGPVVVVGGGSTAMDAARSALRSGADAVMVLYRRGRADMPAQPEEIEAAEREGIAIRTGVVVDEVLGNGRAGSVRCQLQQPTGRVEAGRAVWESVPASQVEISCATILVAIGEEPDPSILPSGAGIEVSSWAGIMADPRTLATGRAGVFAGGDVVSGPKTVIDAVANGRRAAASIHQYLSGARDGEAEIFAAVRYRTSPDQKLTLHLAPRERARVDHPGYVPGSFTANEPGLDDTSARAEASRCFRCDAVYSCGAVQVRSGRGPQDTPSGPTAAHRAPGTFPVVPGTTGGAQR